MSPTGRAQGSPHRTPPLTPTHSQEQVMRVVRQSVLGDHPTPGRGQAIAPTMIRMKRLARDVYGGGVPLRSLFCLVFSLTLALLLSMTLSLIPARASAFSMAPAG